MMIETTKDVMTRIKADLTTLETLLSTKANEPIPSWTDTFVAVKATVPALKDRYTVAEAEAERRNIDAAFDAGLITYDKRRGMKMNVTKRTEGWSPT